MRTTVIKDVNEMMPYAIDWSSRGLGVNIIITSVWQIIGRDQTLEIDSDSIGAPPVTTQAYFTGGVLGEFYTVANTVTLSDNTVLAESFVLEVVRRYL